VEKAKGNQETEKGGKESGRTLTHKIRQVGGKGGVPWETSATEGEKISIMGSPR